jgi:hypothetical protein
VKTEYWDLIAYIGFGTKFVGLGMIIGAGLDGFRYFYLLSAAIILIGICIGVFADKKRKLQEKVK